MEGEIASSDHHHLGHHHIAEDVLIEILLRLPVKSLLRFKCVCKRWYDLIRNPNFVHTHLRFQKIHKKGRLLLQHFNDDTKQYGYALFPDGTLSSVEYHDIDQLQHVFVESSVALEGPINGLFCLFNDVDRVILWNPAMREFRFLPFPQPNFPSYFTVYSACIGFGSDPLTDDDDDCKLVLIRKFDNSLARGLHSEYGVDAMLYTLSTNSWRHLDGLESLPHGNSVGASSSHTYLNGVYYWLAQSSLFSDDHCAFAVIAFDMTKEVFREIPGPPIPQSEFESQWGFEDLTLYDDHIALHMLKELARCGTDRWMDIWVMQDEEGTWVKKWKLGPLPGFVWHLGIWNNGKLLFVNDASFPQFDNFHSQLVLYDPSNQEIRELGPKGTGSHFSAGVYYESLVSVKGGKNQRKGKLSEISVKSFLLPPDLRSSFVSHLVHMMQPRLADSVWA